MTVASAMNIAGLVAGFAGALVLARPWHSVVITFQLRRNEANRRSMLKEIDKAEKRSPRTYGEDKISAAAGRFEHFTRTKTASMLDGMHQLDRRTSGLVNMSLIDSSGSFSRKAVNASFDELDAAIRNVPNEKDPKDLSGIATWLLTAGFALQLLGAIV